MVVARGTTWKNIATKPSVHDAQLEILSSTNRTKTKKRTSIPGLPHSHMFQGTSTNHGPLPSLPGLHAVGWSGVAHPAEPLLLCAAPVGLPELRRKFQGDVKLGDG